MPLIEELLIGVASHGLPGAPAVVSHDYLDAAVWTGLVRQARRQQLLGWMGVAVIDEVLVASDDQLDELRRIELEWFVRLQPHRRLLLECAAEFDRQGIDYLALDGLALTHVVGLQFGQCSVGDVELIVAADSFPAAYSALEVRFDAVADLSSKTDPRPDATLRLDTGTIRLGRSIVSGPFGYRVDHAGLRSGGKAINIDDATIQTVDANIHMVAACYRAALDRSTPTLGALRDVATLADGSYTDPQTVVELAVSWRGAAPLAAGLRVAFDRLHCDEPDLVRWAASTPVSSIDRAFMASYGAFDRPTSTISAGLVLVDGWRERIDLTSIQEKYRYPIAKGRVGSGSIDRLPYE
ncbi:MAG: hypothetical protein V3V01_16135 [Acidimicrobiales bacterium]